MKKEECVSKQFQHQIYYLRCMGDSQMPVVGS